MSVFASAAAMCALLGVPVNGSVIVQHSGSADPTTEGWTNVGGEVGHAVINDLSTGINAWNSNGTWCCQGYQYLFTGAQTADVAAANWVLTVTVRDLSTDTSGGYGPNSYGSSVSLGFDGIRFDVGLHTDGKGGQILAPDPFDSNIPTYDIANLGTAYATIVVDYDAATKTADYYYNGTKVISGFSGFTAFGYNGMGIGASGLGGNYNLIQLQIPSATTISPEPGSWFLLPTGLGALIVLRRRLARR